MAETTGLDVIAVKEENLPSYNAEIYKAVLGELLPPLNPAYVLLPHTTQGWDFAPGLAVKLGAACVTGVERFFIQDDRPCFTRSICNGKIVVDVSPKAEPTVLTVQPGYWKAASFTAEKAGNVDVRTSSHKPEQSRSMEIIHAKEESSALVRSGRGCFRRTRHRQKGKSWNSWSVLRRCSPNPPWAVRARCVTADGWNINGRWV